MYEKFFGLDELPFDGLPDNRFYFVGNCQHEALELLNKTDVLLVFNDDVVNEFDFDFKSISQVIAFSPSKNDTTEVSDAVIPIKSWLEYDGSFTNAEGLTQEFGSVCESDKMGIVEIIDKINGDLE